MVHICLHYILVLNYFALYYIPLCTAVDNHDPTGRLQFTVRNWWSLYLASASGKQRVPSVVQAGVDTDVTYKGHSHQVWINHYKNKYALKDTGIFDKTRYMNMLLSSTRSPHVVNLRWVSMTGSWPDPEVSTWETNPQWWEKLHNEKQSSATKSLQTLITWRLYHTCKPLCSNINAPHDNDISRNHYAQQHQLFIHRMSCMCQDMPTVWCNCIFIGIYRKGIYQGWNICCVIEARGVLN